LHLKSISRFFCGSASGSGFTSWFSSQRYRFEDPHLHPDPYQMSRIRNTTFYITAANSWLIKSRMHHIWSSFNWRRLSQPLEMLWGLPMGTRRLCSSVPRFHKTVMNLKHDNMALSVVLSSVLILWYFWGKTFFSLKFLKITP